MEDLQDKTTVTDCNLKADMERWQKTKKRDMKKLLTDWCDRNITYYQAVRLITPAQINLLPVFNQQT